MQTVDARLLHEWLGVGKQFSHWVRGRITSYDFQEGEDYLIAKKSYKHPTGTKHRIEYSITLDMAKELAMCENNAQGKAARKYFIRMEKQAKEMYAEMKAMATMSRGDMLRTIADREDKLEVTQAALAVALPKAIATGTA